MQLRKLSYTQWNNSPVHPVAQQSSLRSDKGSRSEGGPDLRIPEVGVLLLLVLGPIFFHFYSSPHEPGHIPLLLEPSVCFRVPLTLACFPTAAQNSVYTQNCVHTWDGTALGLLPSSHKNHPLKGIEPMDLLDEQVLVWKKENKKKKKGKSRQDYALKEHNMG